MLTKQALSWFAPLFERKTPILNNFEVFLAAFAEAFKDHDKACLATIKIRVLWQGLDPKSVYASNFKLLYAILIGTKKCL